MMKIKIGLVIINLFFAISCMNDKTKQENDIKNFKEIIDKSYENSQRLIVQSGVIPIKVLKEIINQYSVISSPGLQHIIAKYIGSQFWQFKEIFSKTPENKEYCHKCRYNINLSPNGKYLIATIHMDTPDIFSPKYEIEIWDFNKKTLMDKIPISTDRGVNVVFTYDNKLAISDSMQIRIYDIDSKRFVPCEYNIGEKGLFNLEFSNDGKYLIHQNTHRILKLFNLNTNSYIELNGSGDGHAQGVTALCISPDSKLILTGDTQGLIKVWDLEEHKCIKILEGSKSSDTISHKIKQLQYSKNCEYFASLSWVIKKGTLLRLLRPALASHDEETYYHIDLWNANTYKLIHTFENTGCMNFSPDSQYLAVGYCEDSVKIFSLDENRFIFNLSAMGHGSELIIYSPDGQYLIILKHYGEIIVWEITDKIKLLERDKKQTY